MQFPGLNTRLKREAIVEVTERIIDGERSEDVRILHFMIPRIYPEDSNDAQVLGCHWSPVITRWIPS